MSKANLANGPLVPLSEELSAFTIALAPTPCHNNPIAINQYKLTYQNLLLLRDFWVIRAPVTLVVRSQNDVRMSTGLNPLIPSIHNSNDCGKIDTVFVITLWEFRFDIVVRLVGLLFSFIFCCES